MTPYYTSTPSYELLVLLLLFSNWDKEFSCDWIGHERKSTTSGSSVTTHSASKLLLFGVTRRFKIDTMSFLSCLRVAASVSG